MTRSRRLAWLLVPLAAGLMSAAIPGQAQQSGNSGRFAFADTTLLRDTLGLTFEGLFPLAESLRTTPDTLRALSIRYVVPLWRLVQMADSMRAPVDSVGARIERERYNPLAAREENSTDFLYGTGYNVAQNSTKWSNNLDTRLVRGSLYYSNLTTLQMEEYVSTRSTTRRETRHSANELGFRLSPGASVGVRAVFDRFTSDDPSSITSIDEPQSNYQLSIRTRQEPSPNLKTEFNLLGGGLMLDSELQRKRGGSGEVNGHVTYDVGDAISNDVSGSLSGDLSNVVLKKKLVNQNTHDLSQSLHATTILWPAGRASVSGDVSYRNNFNQVPDDSDFVRDTRNANLDVAGTLRLRGARDRQLNLTQLFSTADVASAVRGGQSDRHGNSMQVDGRTPLFGGTLEGRFGHDWARANTPQLSDSGGYGERTENRSLEGTLSRQFGTKITARLNSSISLARSRYLSIGRYVSLPVPRDQAQQRYRLEGIYTASANFNTNAALEVSRVQLVNLPSSSVLSNNVTRNYRVDWGWTFRLLDNLTANQKNSVLATYSDYTFNAANDRLSIDYNTTTTLNAVLSPRLAIDLSHYAQTVQGGQYLLQSDGLYSFLPSDDNKNYQLGTRVTWTPLIGVSLSVEPRYRFNRRLGTQDGVAVPQRDNGNLTVVGNANLNLAIGKRGKLIGNVGRQYQDDLTNTYGTNASTFQTEIDYWTSSLQLTWHL